MSNILPLRTGFRGRRGGQQPRLRDMVCAWGSTQPDEAHEQGWLLEELAAATRIGVGALPAVLSLLGWVVTTHDPSGQPLWHPADKAPRGDGYGVAVPWNEWRAQARNGALYVSPVLLPPGDLDASREEGMGRTFRPELWPDYRRRYIEVLRLTGIYSSIGQQLLEGARVLWGAEAAEELEFWYRDHCGA